MDIPLNKVKRGRFQPRQHFDEQYMLGLAGSIRDQGLINPIIVFVNGDGNYELVAGECRWRAHCALAIINRGDLSLELPTAISLVCLPEAAETMARDYFFLAGYTIRAEVVEGDDLQRLHQASIIDNLQRADLTPIEEAHALLDLKTKYGYSLRQLADIVGKSKSWCDDRLNLLNLVDDVATMVNNKSDGPGLDLSLARDLARKIPTDLQPLLAAHLTQKLAQGTNLKDLQKQIGDVARFVDSNRWSLSHNLDLPFNPIVYNRARFLRHLLEVTPPRQLSQGLIKLLGEGSHYTPNYLSKKVDTILSSNWEFSNVVQMLTGKSDPWLDHAKAQDWTCDHCILNSLVKVITLQNDELDNSAPCQQINRYRDPEKKILTCLQFIGTEDPPIIVVPFTIINHLDNSGGRDLLKHPLCGEDKHYVTSWQDYVFIYQQARLRFEQAASDEVEMQSKQHLGPLAQYWQAQQDGLFALENFQAHACRSCTHFDGDECKFVHKPLYESHNNKITKSPGFGVLVNKDGLVVPRCEMFRYRDLPEIRPLQGYRFPDRNLIMDWFKLIKSQANPRFYGAQKNLFGILAWLPSQKSENFLADIDDDNLLMAILQTGVQEIVNLRSYTSRLNLLDPVTGENIEWQAMDWGNFMSQEKPYAWNNDWPLPWEKKGIS